MQLLACLHRADWLLPTAQPCHARAAHWRFLTPHRRSWCACLQHGQHAQHGTAVPRPGYSLAPFSAGSWLPSGALQCRVLADGACTRLSVYVGYPPECARTTYIGRCQPVVLCFDSVTPCRVPAPRPNIAVHKSNPGTSTQHHNSPCELLQLMPTAMRTLTAPVRACASPTAATAGIPFRARC